MLASARICLEDDPKPADLSALKDALAAFNVENAGPDRFQRMFLSVRDSEHLLRGGLIGATYWSWLFIGLLFVDPACRGQGLGAELLARAEALAIERARREPTLSRLARPSRRIVAFRRAELASARLGIAAK